MPQLFREFVDQQERQSRRHLRVIRKLLESKGMKSKAFLEDEDPYVYLYATNKKCSFDGVRIYHIGSQLAYRVQKEADTHPFGKAYKIDVDEMFSDLLSDYEPKQAGKHIIEAVARDMKRFFDQAAKAEDDLVNDPMYADDKFDRVVPKSTGADWSSRALSKG
jgi:hypothetical protein